MSWIPLNEGGDRLEHLPLILAGPILRRTEPTAITVWVALKAPRQVTLKVYATEANGSTITTLLLTGTRATTPLGQHLHLVAVTATPITSAQLEPGQLYAYDLSFGELEPTLAPALTATRFPQVTVSYFEHELPTFAMPPEDLNQLRLAHGSCRKLHGGGQDTLPILDDLIGYSAQDPNSRLHQLFFTGDQIYGDDVADPLLWVATQVGDTLLGWEELLPFETNGATKKAKQLKPGERTEIARDYGGFTAMLVDQPELAKSHLFSLGEYVAAYLLVWSPIVWPERLPKGEDIHQDPNRAKFWDEQAYHVYDCIAQLGKVRRAMANVPVYMICDDHDVSDDWYLNQAWCIQVLGKPLGRRVVHNGLLAYAVFQAWGNTPEQFEEGQPGGQLLHAATRWSMSAGTDEAAGQDMAKYLGLPKVEPITGLPQFKLDHDVWVLDRDYGDGTVPIQWHYTVRSLKHEVIVLDTRTWRGYPQQGAIAPPMLLCPIAFTEQIQTPLQVTDQLNATGEANIQVTFVVVPTNLVSLQIIDFVQQQELEQGLVFNSDVGDSWNLNEIALSRLLGELFQRRQQVVVLTGDIHYGGTVRLSYWCRGAVEISDQDSNTIMPKANAGVLAQLTASAFKNGELKTHVVHTKVKSLAPEQPKAWAGWNKPPQLVEIQVTPQQMRILDVEVPAKGPVVRQILGARGTWNIAWQVVPKDDESLPDWQYYIEWIKRDKARLAPWKQQPVSAAIFEPKSSMKWLTLLINWVLMLWRNPWLQEGEEVVGRNNFGVVSLQWSHEAESAKAVIQDNYWQPPWQPTSVVYSRYVVPLYIDQRPPSLKAINGADTTTDLGYGHSEKAWQT